MAKPRCISRESTGPRRLAVRLASVPGRILFTQDEVAELLLQHSADTGQVFDLQALRRIFELTRGQPWLVNALARQLVEVVVPDQTQWTKLGGQA